MTFIAPGYSSSPFRWVVIANLDPLERRRVDNNLDPIERPAQPVPVAHVPDEEPHPRISEFRAIFGLLVLASGQDHDTLDGRIR
jgi:hypothetical protein